MTFIIFKNHRIIRTSLIYNETVQCGTESYKTGSRTVDRIKVEFMRP